MKKLFFIIGLVSATSLGFVSCSDDNKDDYQGQSTSITAGDLPTTAKNFISTYFSGSSVQSASQYSSPNVRNSVYKALLNNNFEIDFDKNGNWTEIESKTKQAIPDSFLTQEVPAIADYIKVNYPNNWIVEIDKENYGYSVELNSGLELIFNQSQQFVGIDVDNDKDNEEVINYADLPQAAKNFVGQNFTNAEYVMVKKETEYNQVSYEVYLSTGYKIEFNAAGEWKEIESKTSSALPSSVVPSAISTYVSTNYTGYSITSIEKENYGYAVEITKGNNDIDLKFSSTGNFLGIDD
ncbi:PepSY-like domain-containing protein [Chryseobacterium sp.]|uniref:PepSY-like domain-containing protein n=1 Tax=Chryseobacterium sp. TaxID=1871047 RepID=UPI0025BE04A2|nr:PepSY-like domain-containing protein [Chryseobacterium sp.]